MKLEVTELNWVDDDGEYSLIELAERSRLSTAEILELIDCGVLWPGDPRATSVARTAARLRDDFEIDLQGVALALTLLKRIHELETELGQLRVRHAL